MTHSLQRQLTRTLTLVILLTGLAASLVSLYFSYVQAEEFQDDALRQIAVLTSGSRADESRVAAANRAVIDPESRVRVVRMSQGPLPPWLPAGISDGFHTLDTPSGQFRVFVRNAYDGGRIAVIQPTDARNEIAFDSALRTLLPPLLLLPLLIVLVARLVRRELAVVRSLAESLDRQPADHPQALPERDMPDEISPFVGAINRLLDRVNRAAAEQRRFIADAAHELRTPLTALSLQAQNLESAESQNAMLERIAPLKAGIERARRLTEQLLNLARTRAGTDAAEAVDVSRLARELIAQYLPLAETRGIDVGLDEAEPVTLAAVAEPLRLIVKNALDNAVRYTPAGGEVTLRIGTENGDAIIEVVDSGPGIPADERERAFDPFHRLPDTQGEGSGLGLAIARDAAARLGGQVSLHDRADGANGLVFRYRQALKPLDDSRANTPCPRRWASSR